MLLSDVSAGVAPDNPAMVLLSGPLLAMVSLLPADVTLLLETAVVAASLLPAIELVSPVAPPEGDAVALLLPSAGSVDGLKLGEPVPSD